MFSTVGAVQGVFRRNKNAMLGDQNVFLGYQNAVQGGQNAVAVAVAVAPPLFSHFHPLGSNRTQHYARTSKHMSIQAESV